MTLCDYCQLQEDGACPVYPIETTGCAEFRSMDCSAHDAALLIAGGLRAEPDKKEQRRRFALLCDVIQGNR